MSMTDPLGDMLTRIRNAQRAHKPSVAAPASKIRANVLEVLKREGYIRGFTQEQVQQNGHAIEVRLYAEDVPAGFLPTTGTLHRFAIPPAPGIRVDTGFRDGSVVSPHYDAMLAKVIAHGRTRADATRRLARALERGLTGNTTFRLVDYRDVGGRFDRIVSVGMFEHVGVGFYDVFFRRCAQLLADEGIALLHTIGRSGPPGITNPWIAKYIFPGGYIPALSEVLPAVQRAGLLVSDVEILQLHYAETLKAWRERFLAHRDEVLRLYDQRFVRMWEFYLACSEMAFRGSDMVVFQIQLAKHKGVTPATRDYIAREEARLRARERGSAAPLRLAGE